MLAITPEQLWQELKADSDLADMELGAVSVKVLREVAMTLGRVLINGDQPMAAIGGNPDIGLRAARVADMSQPEIQASRFKSQVNSAKLLGANGV